MAGLLTGAAPADKRAVDVDQWYSVRVGGRPTGWIHDTVVREGGRITTREEVCLTLLKAGRFVQITTDEHFVETATGQPIECSSSQTPGSTTQIVQAMRFTSDVIEVTSQQGERVQRQMLPRPRQPWMTPAVAQRYIRQQLQKGAREIRWSTMRASTGPRVLDVYMKILGRQEIQVMGKTVSAFACETRTNAVGDSLEKQYVDASGAVLQTTLSFVPGTPFTVVQASQQEAMRIDPPDLTDFTLVKPDRPIERPRELRSAVYELTVAPDPLANAEDGIGKPQLPQSGCQWVTVTGPGRLRITVDLDQPVPSDGPSPGAEYTAASPMLDSDDPQIRQLTEAALATCSPNLPAAEKAEILRRFVYHHIRVKDSDIGLATASEVARNGRGDCTEHAMLLAAMLRAAGIPSRTVSGLMYVEQFAGRAHVFGQHMWTQAWIAPAADGSADKPRWIDLDATLEATAFDAAHIALENRARDGISLVGGHRDGTELMGRLSVRVLDAQSPRAGFGLWTYALVAAVGLALIRAIRRRTARRRRSPTFLRAGSAVTR